MSKTVGELVKVFMQAADDTYAAEYIDPADTTNVAWRAGVAAVVEALRDEMQFGDWTAWHRLNEILGDTAEARSAGVLAVESREGAMISEAPEAPATDPAPAVCEWREISVLDGIDHYSTKHGVKNRLHLYRKDDVCPVCLAPIKFTEAK